MNTNHLEHQKDAWDVDNALLHIAIIMDIWDPLPFSSLPPSPLSHSLWDKITNNEVISLEIWDPPPFSPIPSFPLSHSLWDMITNVKGISSEIWDQFVGGDVLSIAF